MVVKQRGEEKKIYEQNERDTDGKREGSEYAVDVKSSTALLDASAFCCFCISSMNIYIFSLWKRL